MEGKVSQTFIDIQNIAQTNQIRKVRLRINADLHNSVNRRLATGQQAGSDGSNAVMAYDANHDSFQLSVDTNTNRILSLRAQLEEGPLPQRTQNVYNIVEYNTTMDSRIGNNSLLTGSAEGYLSTADLFNIWYRSELRTASTEGINNFRYTMQNETTMLNILNSTHNRVHLRELSTLPVRMFMNTMLMSIFSHRLPGTQLQPNR